MIQEKQTKMAEEPKFEKLCTEMTLEERQAYTKTDQGFFDLIDEATGDTRSNKYFGDEMLNLGNEHPRRWEKAVLLTLARVLDALDGIEERLESIDKKTPGHYDQ